MNDITAQGQTVDEAIQNALKELKTTRENVAVEVIDEGKKGIFGIGSRLAMVKVIEKVDEIRIALDYLQNIALKMGAKISVEVEENGRDVYFQISGENLGLLIGKHGTVLNALQHLTQHLLNKQSDQYKNIILNIENYRERRSEILTNLAIKTALKAVKTNKTIHLEPMPSFERKVIHLALSDHNEVETDSKGNDPYRYVVIKPIYK